MSENTIVLTKEGKAKLEAEYRHLVDVENPAVREELALARSNGDLSENADYDAARNHQAQVEARIAEIEHILDIATVVDPVSQSDKKINFGYTVTYAILDSGETMTVKLVGTTEADPLAEPPLVSSESMLGKSLLGRSVGDKVLIEAEEPYTIKITDAGIE
jgi:transcription elongation factor GreA